MKIAFLHQTMGLTDRGSEIVTGELASALARHHRVLVLQSGPAKPAAYQTKRVYPLDIAPHAAPRNFVEKFTFRFGLDPRTRAVAVFTHAAIPAIRAFHPDIVVAVNGPVQVRILKHLQGPTLRGRVVVFGHAGIGHDDLGNLHAGPDLFVALTPQAEVWAQRHRRSNTKIVYIPNPISTSILRSIEVKKLQLPHPVVLTVSALSAYKNVVPIIRALTSTNTSYVLVGDGEQSDQVAGALSQYSGEFRWIKHVEPSELSAYYQSADVFCFVPEPQEAFGRVYLEAMAAGLPVVASDDPVRRDLIGEKGIYVAPHAPKSILSGIESALSLGKVGYASELRRYSLASVVKKVEKEFHALI